MRAVLKALDSDGASASFQDLEVSEEEMGTGNQSFFIIELKLQNIKISDLINELVSLTEDQRANNSDLPEKGKVNVEERKEDVMSYIEDAADTLKELGLLYDEIISLTKKRST